MSNAHADLMHKSKLLNSQIFLEANGYVVVEKKRYSVLFNLATAVSFCKRFKNSIYSEEVENAFKHVQTEVEVFRVGLEPSKEENGKEETE